MIRISGRVQGLQETQAALQQVSTLLMDEMDAAMRASLFQTTRIAQKSYLSGPRPGRLGVITNRLRGSLSEGKPGFIMNVERNTFQITGTVGTNVEYATTHEPPDGRTETIIKSSRPGGFLAVPTAFAKTPAGALKDIYNRPLRQIEGLFIARAKSGTLFAAIKSSATGRQRSSKFTPLFWLLKSVKIPARPFLAPALKDATPWIQERFQKGVHAVEQRINALLRGR